MERAEKGIEALIKHVDALIVIPNQNLITNEMRLTMKQSYAIADEVLKTDVIAIAEIITRHDEINVDFADVTTILKGAGRAHIAIGHGEGIRYRISSIRSFLLIFLKLLSRVREDLS